MKCLNLGCGTRFHPAWTNVDYVATDPSIMVHDLRAGIPFPDEEFEVVYLSHLLEHIPRSSVAPFLRECCRVLKPGGTIRIAVPDLEQIARAYLQALEEALKDSEHSQANYDWLMLELYDQTVREVSGGDLSEYLFRENIPNRDFVIGRVGVEARQAIEYAERARKNRADQPASESRTSILRRLYRFVRDSAARREAIVRRVLGEEYELLQVGRFRRSGELHLWMYDRYSVARVVCEAGFSKPQVVNAAESRIPGWAEYNLDTTPDGAVYKPDSLFMEATK